MSKQLHKKWRAAFNADCLNRDGHKCAICGLTVGTHVVDGRSVVVKLDVHHITDRHEMPNGGYVPENGITLCDHDGSSCHKKAEVFHATHYKDSVKGFTPEELYRRINSSTDKAFTASLRLSKRQPLR